MKVSTKFEVDRLRPSVA